MSYSTFNKTEILYAPLFSYQSKMVTSFFTILQNYFIEPVVIIPYSQSCDYDMHAFFPQIT